MAHNLTVDIPIPNNIFRRYLLGESFKNIFIRLTVILSFIIIVWICLMISSSFCMMFRRRKQMKNLLNSDHHLCDSTFSSTNNQLNNIKRTRRYYSSSSSLTPTICCPILGISSRFKQKCLFWSRKTENSPRRTSREESTFLSNPNQTQIVLKAMTRSPSISNQKTTTVKNIYSQYYNQNDKESATDRLSIQQNRNIINVNNSIPMAKSRVFTRHSFSSGDITEEYQSPNLIQNRSFLMVSSKHDLTPNKRRYTLSNDHTTNIDNHSEYLPLVMITDTNSSYTNILELETFEDKHRLMTDIDKNLTSQLRASYPPEQST